MKDQRKWPLYQAERWRRYVEMGEVRQRPLPNRSLNHVRSLRQLRLEGLREDDTISQ